MEEQEGGSVGFIDGRLVEHGGGGEMEISNPQHLLGTDQAKPWLASSSRVQISLPFVQH